MAAREVYRTNVVVDSFNRTLSPGRSHRGRPKVQYRDSAQWRQTEQSPQLPMITMNKRLFALIVVCFAFALQSVVIAGTVPAGTSIVVRTSGAISTHATPHRHFGATLDRSVGGLPAGTGVIGYIEASRARATSRSNPLTLTLTSISANGKNVSIKTDSVQPESAKTTSTKRGNFSFGEYTFPPGTRLEFHLSQPANL